MFDALREKSMGVSVGGMLETEHGLQERDKEEVVGVGPGLREFEAGCETNNTVELRVRWRGHMHRRGGIEHERVKVGAANRT